MVHVDVDVWLRCFYMELWICRFSVCFAIELRDGVRGVLGFVGFDFVLCLHLSCFGRMRIPDFPGFFRHL